MAGTRMTVDARKVLNMLEGMAARCKDLAPAMRLIGETVRTSIVRNFEVGGRPRWKGHSAVTKKRRKGGSVLRLSNQLMNSITYSTTSRSVEVGTNRVYAATHQFGAKKGAFGKTKRGGPTPWGDIPARPFVMVQDEDWPVMRDDIAEFVLGDENK